MNERENEPESRSILEQILDRMFEVLHSDQNFPMELVGRLQRLNIQQLAQADTIRMAIERGAEGKMRLIELEIHNIRGIRELKLNPDGHNMVICGPNGTGKSAIVDAIDFLLTGNMSRLVGKGTSGITVKKHGVYLGAKPAEAFVKATVQIGDDVLEISRGIGGDGDLTYSGPCWPQLEKSIQMARLGHHILTRREILRFITATGSERAKEVMVLLNIDEIDDVRKALNTAYRSLEDKRKDNERRLDEQTRRVCIRLGLRIFDWEEAWKVVNRWRETLGGEPLAGHDLRKLKIGLLPPGEQPSAPIGRNRINEGFSVAYDCFSRPAVDSRQQASQRLQEITRQLHAQPRLLQDLKAVELVRMGRTMLDGTGKCPLCLVVHEPHTLDAFLHQRLQMAGEALQLQSEINELLSELHVSIDTLKYVLVDFERAAGASGLSAERESLDIWSRNLDQLHKTLELGREEYSWTEGAATLPNLALPDDFPARLARVSGSLLEAVPDISPQLEAWTNLTQLEVDLEQWYRLQEEVDQAWKQVTAATKLKSAYEQASKQVLVTLYEQISGRFAELYRCMHGEDESGFIAELAPSGAALNFKVDFHGLGTHPPHALHSEGHQDSMGVCLYLALAERLTQGALDLIVLDDVVMSVDIDHRQQLCRLLNERYSHRQLIITTHDSVWATQLRKAGVVKEKGLVKLTSWSYETGPQLGEMVDLWQQIDRDLACEDIHAAAARLRRGLEEFAYHACDALQARVRFSMDMRWELGDVLPAAVGRYRECLKQGKSAAQTWGREELFNRFRKQEAAFTEICTKSDVERWTVNPSVHYNAWVNFSLGEFRQTVAAQRALVEQFYCPECGGLIYLVEEGKTEVGVRCPCDAIHWNLEKKHTKIN